MAAGPLASPIATVSPSPGSVAAAGGAFLPDTAQGVQVTGIVEDASEGPLVYEPGHPDADANGYVRYPNVRITDEMVDLMDARRVFEANATVFQSAKQMLRRALEI
jgi:flagellar basal-body rod protein FlgC